MARPLTFPINAPGARQTASAVVAVRGAFSTLRAAVSGTSPTFKALQKASQAATGQLTGALDPAVGRMSKAWQTNQKELAKLNAEVNDGALFAKETRSRMENALSTMVEFGATQAQVEQGQAKITQTSQKMGVTHAVAAKALEKLVDESENADVAMGALEDTLRVQAITGGKVEDVAKEMGAAFQGDTKILQRFDGQAKRAAKAIDEVNDPAKRAELIQKELTAALRRQTGVMGSVRRSYQSMRAQLSTLGPAFGVVKGAVLAVAGTIGGALVKSVKTYLGHSKTMSRQQKALSEAFHQFSGRVGSVVSQSIQLDKVMERLTQELNNQRTAAESNSSALGNVARFFAKLAIGAANLVGSIGFGVAMLVTFIVDGVTKMVKGALGGIAELAREVGQLLHDQGFLDPGTLKTLEQFANVVSSDTRHGTGDFGLTQKVEGYFSQFQSLLGDIEGIVDGGEGRTIKNDRIGRKGGAGGGGGGSSVPDEYKLLFAKESKYAQVQARAAKLLDKRLGKEKALGDVALRFQEAKLEGFAQEMDQYHNVIQLQRDAEASQKAQLASRRKAVFLAQIPDPLPPEKIAAIKAEAAALSEAARAQRLAMRDEEEGYSEAVRKALTGMRQQTAALQAQKKAMEDIKKVGIDAASSMIMAFGQAFAIIATGTGAIGKTFVGVFMSAVGSVVPILQAYGSALLAAQNLSGIGVLVAAGVLAGLLSAAQSAMQGGGGTPTSTPSSSDALQRQYRREREEEKQQTIQIDLYWGTEYVESQTRNLVRQGSELGMTRPRRRRA